MSWTFVLFVLCVSGILAHTYYLSRKKKQQ